MFRSDAVYLLLELHWENRVTAIHDNTLASHEVTVLGRKKYGDPFHVFKLADASNSSPAARCVLEGLAGRKRHFRFDKSWQDRIDANTCLPKLHRERLNQAKYRGLGGGVCLLYTSDAADE